MKRVLHIVATISAVALAACSNDEVIDVSADNEIHVGVTSNVLSRSMIAHQGSSPFSSTYTGDNTFALYALYADTDQKPYFVGEEMTVNTTNQSCSFSGDKRFWPGNKALNFYALHNAKCTYTTGSETTFDGTFANDALDATFEKRTGDTEKRLYKSITLDYSDFRVQDDILYAVTTGVTRPTSGGAVTLNFRHALASVDFNVISANQTLVVWLQDIALCNIYSSGELSFGATSTATQFTASTGANSTYTYSDNCKWTTSGDLGGPFWQMKLKDYPNIYQGPVYKFSSYFGSDYAYTSDVSRVNTSFPLYVIPQTFTPGTFNTTSKTWNGTYMRIRCQLFTITDTDAFKKKLEQIKTQNINMTNMTGKEAWYMLLTAGETAFKAAISCPILDENNPHGPYAIPIFGGPTTPFSADVSDATTINEIGTYRYSKGKEICIPIPALSAGWEPGKKYVYKLTFGTDGTNGGIDDDGNPVLVSITTDLTVDGYALDTTRTLDL